MHLDVLDLRNFYYRTQLGRVAQRAIRDQVVALWPPMAGQTVVGFGFAVPLLRPYLAQSRRVIALMPGPQGVMPWPTGERNVSVLCEDAAWPLATGFVDRLIVMHGLETSDNSGAVLEECYRVLGPGGRALFIVPNRIGLWSRRDGTPFGFGRPYSNGQLEARVEAARLYPRTQPDRAVRPAVAGAVLAAHLGVLGVVGAVGTVAGGGCADGRGQQAGLCPHTRRVGRDGHAVR